MVITLSKAKDIIVVPEKKKSITTLTVERVVDNPTQKFVKVFFKEFDGPTIVWEGSSYDAIGQWTDSDLQNQIQVLFS